MASDKDKLPEESSQKSKNLLKLSRSKITGRWESGTKGGGKTGAGQTSASAAAPPPPENVMTGRMEAPLTTKPAMGKGGGKTGAGHTSASAAALLPPKNVITATAKRVVDVPPVTKGGGKTCGGSDAAPPPPENVVPEVSGKMEAERLTFKYGLDPKIYHSLDSDLSYADLYDFCVGVLRRGALPVGNAKGQSLCSLPCSQYFADDKYAKHLSEIHMKVCATCGNTHAFPVVTRDCFKCGQSVCMNHSC